MEYYAFVFALAFIMLVPLGRWMYRGTPYDFSVRRGNYIGLLIFKDLVLFVGLAVVLLNAFGPTQFHGYANTSEGSVVVISWYVWLACLVFVVSSGLLLKIVSKPALSNKGVAPKPELQSQHSSIRRLTWIVLGLGIGVMVVSVLVFSSRHAVVASLMSEMPLSTRDIRLHNTHASSAPSVLRSFQSFSYTLAAILLGTKAFRVRSRAFLLSSFLIVVLATFHGAKAPVPGAVLVFLVSYLSSRRIGTGKQLLRIGAIGGLVLFVAVIIMVRGQYQEMSGADIALYLVNRLGVGQLAGTYEQFNLELLNHNYLWHAVPFANWFIDYPVFQKDLMLASESVSDPSSTGVKSSLFLSEALAMGGRELAILSPIVVGISFAMTLAILVLCVRLWLQRWIPNAVSSMAILMPTMLGLTGDFSSWLFLKGAALLVVFLGGVAFVAHLVDRRSSRTTRFRMARSSPYRLQ